MKIRKNALEWSVFAVAGAIVIACLVALVVMIVGSDGGRAELVVSVGEPERGASGFLVPVRTRNDGDETAEQVRIEVTLEAGAEEVESSELTMAFVPRRSVRDGYAVFSRDPRCCRIRARATAFERP